MKKEQRICQRCGQVWKWPEDMARAGLCVWCEADLAYKQRQHDEAVDFVTRAR